MRILIACDKFKGSLSATEACEAVRDGMKAAGVADELRLCPITDGGDGFTETMLSALSGEWRTCESFDALHNPVEARYGMLRNAAGEQEAVIEMAEASGLRRIPVDDRNILYSSTFGTGSMIRDAIQTENAQRILVGLGGSAANDGGIGMAAALGTRFLDADGNELQPIPAAMGDLASINQDNLIELPPIEVACNIENPFLGENGSTTVNAPAKGADPEEVQALEAAMTRMVEVAGASEIATMARSGAAGGLGFGLMCFAGARLRNGFNMAGDALGLAGRIAEVDLVITGEGSMDTRTLMGKGTMGVALMAKEQGKSVIGVGGKVAEVITNCQWFDATLSMESFGLTEDECMFRADELLKDLSGHIAGLLRQWESG